MRLKNKLIAVKVFLVLVLNLVLPVKAEPNPGFENNIPVAFGIDNNYFYPSIVAITSLLENANESTFYNIFVIHEKDFPDPYKFKICSLKEKYKNCDIKFFPAKNQVDDYFSSGYFTKAIFFRLEIPGIVEEDKCIYLDSDVVVEEDLSELFNVNIDDYYVAGVRDGTELERSYGDCLKKMGMKNISTYINSGVLLWNLKKVRDDNLQPLFYQFVEKYVIKERTCTFPDQDCINVVCDGKIMNLPIRFNATTFVFSNVLICEKSSVIKSLYSNEELERAQKNPAVIHYLGRYKPWNGNKTVWHERWWIYANRSKFSNEIKMVYRKYWKPCV